MMKPSVIGIAGVTWVLVEILVRRVTPVPAIPPLPATTVISRAVELVPPALVIMSVTG